MTAATLAGALRAGEQRIDALDARALLCHVIDRNAAYFIANPEALLGDEAQAAYAGLVERRAAGEPVAYLTGAREFFGRTFKVTAAVLIPRPETELLVELALERIARDVAVRVLDLGTGSGCVAISIASERAHAKVTAVDQSLEALAVARENAARLGAGNVVLLESDWFSALPGAQFDLIVSNPPYVAQSDPHLNAGDLRFEPRAALESGPDGLDAIRRIVLDARAHLAADGWLMFEHGYDQAARARALLRSAGYEDVFSAQDLARIERASGGRLTPSVRGR